jgi:hypothetical protein
VSNPQEVKPGQVWHHSRWGHKSIVLSVKDDYVYLQGAETGRVTRHNLGTLPRHYKLVSEGEPPQPKTVNPSQAAPYLTYIPDRTPLNKVHESLGQAKKAITFRSNRRNGLASNSVIYQWVDGKGWETLHELPAGTRTEDLPWR